MPVDRVVAGILAALTAPEAIGNRIHLATDNRIRSEDMVRITREELGVRRAADRSDAVPQRDPAGGEGGARRGWASRGWRAPSRSWARSSAATASGASPSTTWATTCASWACPSAGPTPTTPSACCAATTATCRSSAACATATRSARRERAWEKAIDGHRAARPATRRAPSRAAEFRRLLADRIELRAFRARR